MVPADTPRSDQDIRRILALKPRPVTPVVKPAAKPTPVAPKISPEQAQAQAAIRAAQAQMSLARTAFQKRTVASAQGQLRDAQAKLRQAQVAGSKALAAAQAAVQAATTALKNLPPVKVQPTDIAAAQAALKQAQGRLQALQAPPAPHQVAFTQPRPAGAQQNPNKDVVAAQAQVAQAQARLAKLQQALADANAALAAAQKRLGDAQQNLANLQQSVPASIAAAQARVTQAQAELVRVQAGGTAEPGWMWPTFGTITSPFGLRNMKVGRNHNGVDVANAQGTPIAAAHDGVVTEAGWCAGYGYCVKMSHPGGFSTEYGHMASPPPVKAGQKVKVGTLIGAMGTTYDAAHGGLSTGVHLHFTLRLDGTAIDPLLYLP